MYDSGWGYFHGGFGPLMWLFWIVLLVAFVYFLRGLFGRGAGPGNTAETPREKSALEVLEERYAKGEIGKEEFEERRRVLKSG